MYTIGRKEIPETLDELVEPSRTVLLVHDTQNDYCAPKGKLFTKSNPEVQAAITAAIDGIVPLIQVARDAGTRIVFTRASHLKDGADESPVHLRHLIANQQRGSEPNVLIGSWGHQIVDRLEPQRDDIVIDKFAFSAFQGTALDKLLRSFGTQTIVLCGIASHSGILTSARFALTLDYFTVIPEQCIAGTDRRQHEAALQLLRPDLIDTGSLLALWAKSAESA